MNVLEKINLISSIKDGKQKFINEYEMVQSHLDRLYTASNQEKFIEEMRFYDFIVNQWDDYRFNMEKKHLNLN